MPAPASINGRQLIVLSNRQPYQHRPDSRGGVQVVRCSSGVVNAVEPLLLEHRGVWVASADGEADHLMAGDASGIEVPPAAPRYRLRRVFLSPAEQHGYYSGFANSGLWPLCHRTEVAPEFNAADFGTYELVNRRFADAVAEESRQAAPIVLVQDYHFALAPSLIRRQLPLSRIATFWHIPFPPVAALRRCPWHQALVEGLLGSTVIGFQTTVDRDHFLRAAETVCSVDLDTHTVSRNGRAVQLCVYPASVEWPGAAVRSAPSVGTCRAAVRARLGVAADVRLGLGVDRLDYTKGIEEKFLAIERLLESRPDLRRRLVFVQIAQPSREALPAYQQTRERVVATAARINERFGGGAPPIVLLLETHTQEAIVQYMRAADCCYVGSLHDGMNLVSKEFVAARDDEQGVLVLSAAAGASHELRDALIVNPYDVEHVARSLAFAFEMPQLQQRYRMRRLRRVVAGADARVWASRMLSDVAREGVPAARPAAYRAASTRASASV